MWQQLLDGILKSDHRSLARAISFVENESPGYEDLLKSLPSGKNPPVIGFTGPPGAGKSTLADALIELLVAGNKKIAVLCVDPSSPFNLGSLLGDRIRMSAWYNHPAVFIRSLASRGSLGGLHPKIIEITELLKAAQFDYILVETVGVGQSEVEIAGLADVTLVIVVPEGGDEVQTMKAGIMEIADVFVVNKCDRPGADLFVKNLRMQLAPAFKTHNKEVPVVKTIAAQKEGVREMWLQVERYLNEKRDENLKNWLLAERAYQLIQKKRMKGIDKNALREKIKALKDNKAFNLYSFIQDY